MSEEKTVIPPGTKVYVIDHWTGHCAHKRGQKITITGRGFVESYDGCFSGSYEWEDEESGDMIIGYTTGLRVSLTPPEVE